MLFLKPQAITEWFLFLSMFNNYNEKMGKKLE